MAIKRSSAREIDALIADLADGSVVAREAAQARLAVIGARAVDRLVALAESTAPADVRAAAFHALEAIADPRALEPALRALEDLPARHRVESATAKPRAHDPATDADRDVAVALAAIGVACAFVRGRSGAHVVDRLTAVALDHAGVEQIRLAAVRALGALGEATIRPVLAQLANDPSSAVRDEAKNLTPRRQRAGKRSARDSSEGALASDAGAADAVGDDPRAVHDVVSAEGSHLPLPVLLRIVERLREKEAVDPDRAAEWASARAAAHVALATRGSRLGLYDLRESLAAERQPLPVELLSALAAVGDASCLEPIAAARARTHDEWFRVRVADVFRTIVAREGLTRRHAVVKKIEKKWPAVVDELWSAQASRASRRLRDRPARTG